MNAFQRANTKKLHRNATLLLRTSFNTKNSGTKAPKIRKGKPEGGQENTIRNAETKQSSKLRNIFCIIAKQISYFLSIFKHIPNLITLGNLSFGIAAILLAFGGNLILASICILSGAFLDFFDGFFARLLKVSGDLGKQLDSLADLISFGLAPSVIVFQILFQLETEAYFNPSTGKISDYTLCYLAYIAFLIPLFSAYRLAKFNIDTRQTDAFIGLPTPANALFFISIPFVMTYHKEGFVYDLITHTETIVVCIALFCILMVSELELIALKFKTKGWSENKYRYILIALSVILLLLLRFEAVPIILILYIVLSIINKQVK